MLQYLRKGKLAYVFGKTLFLHGAIDSKTMVSLCLYKTKTLSGRNQLFGHCLPVFAWTHVDTYGAHTGHACQYVCELMV